MRGFYSNMTSSIDYIMYDVRCNFTIFNLKKFNFYKGYMCKDPQNFNLL